MKALMTWIVAAVFVAGLGVVLADGADGCTDKSVVAGQKAGTTAKKSYTCNCDSPCSGSKTCPNGCYVPIPGTPYLIS